MDIRKGLRVQHTTFNNHRGTVQAKRADRVLVLWDDTGKANSIKIDYLKLAGENDNGYCNV